MKLGLQYGTNPDGTRTVTLPDETRAGVIAFVQDGGTKPAAEIERIVREGHDEMLAVLAGLSETQAAHKPAPDRWSILELMAHVVSVKRVIGTLAAAMAAGALPPGFGPQFEEMEAQDGFAVVKFDTLAAALEAAREAHDAAIAYIRTLDNDGLNTSLTFRHFLFGPFNCREWPVFWRIHDFDHTPQIAQIKASPGFPAS